MAGANAPGRARAQSGESTRVEQVAAEALTKAAHVILGARLPSRAASEAGPSNRWFNLETEELACAARPLEPWRRDCGRPLVLDVLGGGGDGAPPEPLERWVMWYRRKGTGGGGSSSGGSSSGGSSSFGGSSESWGSGSASFSPGGTRMRRSSSESRRAGHLDTPLVYKRSVIMLRSLYSMSRRLPAYGLFAALRRRQRAGGGAAAGAGADMGFRIHPPEAGGAADPTALQPGMTQFRFTPVETPSGFLDFSVQYLEELPPPLATVAAAGAASAATAPASATVSSRSGSSPLYRSPGSSCGASPPDSALRPRRPSWSPVQAKAAGPAAGDLDVEYAPPRSARLAAPGSVSSSQSSGSYLGRSAERFSRSPVFGYLGSAGKPPLSGASPPLPGVGAPAAGPKPAEAQRLRSGAITIGFAEGSGGGSYRASAGPKAPLPVSGLSPQARDPAGPPGPAAELASGSSGASPCSNPSSGTGPMSCSPQLPFAFTPRNQSLNSNEGDLGVSPPITGRNSMALSVIRRSTWSPRSSLDSGSRQASPGLDAMPTSLSAVPVAAQGVGLPDSAGWLQNSSKDSHMDDYPFALESDFVGSSGPLTSYAAMDASGDGGGGDPGGAAIGNLVRLLQEAPPLQKTNYRKQASVSSALLELKQVQQATGAMV